MKITDIIFGVVSIGAGILTLIDKEFWPAGVSLIVAGFIVVYFSNYISEIEEHKEDIKKLKEKLIIHERLNKLEIKVFGK